MRYTVAVLMTTALALGACGTTQRERTTGGAAAGAASGAGLGAFAGPPGAAIGAVVGGGAGAVAGAVTSSKQINLGKPPWNWSHSMVARSEPSTAHRSASSSPPPAPVVTSPPPRYPMGENTGP